MIADMKPCPFCGSQRLAFARGLETEICGILCLTCKAQVRFPIEMGKGETFGENEAKWKEAWNRRKNDDQNDSIGCR